MIEHKNLIKNIPNGCFHSVLMTSYSINLYYWEIQLLKALSNKGINYVSALVDADCLSEQLANFGRSFDGKKPFDFSLHGYRSKGAFHPKIQFYAGREKILVLIGSGNITVSGHGKNMEVWSPIMIDSKESPAYPFVREVWNYLCSLYRDLGDEAYRIIGSIKDNCNLLIDEYETESEEHWINEDYSIRLFTNNNTTIFDQVRTWIGDDRIKSITVMSPFYDSKADFINSLNNVYSPNYINVISEDGFGSIPSINPLPGKLRIYKWSNVKPESASMQKYFHAKCLFYEGEKYNYLVCGSANASIAAFGKPGVRSINHEASVGYKSKTINYFKETGFLLKDRTEFEDIKPGKKLEGGTIKANNPIWIKEASYEIRSYSIAFESEIDSEVEVLIYSPSSQKPQKETIRVKEGQNIHLGNLSIDKPFYVVMTDCQGNIISNRQFIISIYRLVINDPSKENTEYRHRCYDIEIGKFIGGKIFNFIEDVLSGVDERKYKLKTEPEREKQEHLDSEKKTNNFNSEEEYFRKDTNDVTGDKRYRYHTLSTYRKNMVLDSIIYYINHSSSERKDETIDDEETEDVNKSEGKVSKPKLKKNDQEKPDAKLAERVINMLDKYVAILVESSITNNNSDSAEISVMNTIKPFMLALFYLYRILSYRYTEEADEGGNKERKSILPVIFKRTSNRSDVVYIYRIISLFSLHLIKNKHIDEDNPYLEQKLEDYKKYIFELCIAVISICDWLNKGNKDYDDIETLYKKPALYNLHLALGIDLSKITENQIMDKLDRNVSELEGFEPTIIQEIVKSNMYILKDMNEGPIPKDVQRTDKYGFVSLKPHDRNSDLAIPCSMIFEYNPKRNLFSPYNEVYHRKHLKIMGLL